MQLLMEEYIHDTSNRKYILFEDVNRSNNRRALILFSQHDFQRLKKITDNKFQ